VTRRCDDTVDKKRVNSCVLKYIFLEGVEQQQKSQKKPRKALSDALLKCTLQVQQLSHLLPPQRIGKSCDEPTISCYQNYVCTMPQNCDTVMSHNYVRREMSNTGGRRRSGKEETLETVGKETEETLEEKEGNTTEDFVGKGKDEILEKTQIDCCCFPSLHMK